MERLEKVELHLHLGGSYPLEYLQSIASEEKIAELNSFLDLIDNGIDYHDGFKAFDIVSSIVDSEEKVEGFDRSWHLSNKMVWFMLR